MHHTLHRAATLLALTIALTLPLAARAQGGFLHGTETIVDSDIPVAYYLVETIDGLYVPIGLRKPEGPGPFPIVVFASGNGGGGMDWVRDASHNRSWTLDRFLDAGYAAVWMRYRAEVELGFNKNERLVEDIRQGRQLLNRGPLEIDDEIAIVEFLKTLPFVDPDRVAHVGMSHGGEMAMKVTSQYHGLAAAVADEPASHEFLGLTPDDTAFISSDTGMWNIEEMQMRDASATRERINLELARERVSGITTPILVHGRDDDELQGIFRLTYDVLAEAGKETEWESYDHPEHGFIYVERDPDGQYRPDEVQVEVVMDTIAWLDRYLQPESMTRR
jgi:dipeptidyl aminopeptidase/acylaminoacyl peptidase